MIDPRVLPPLALLLSVGHALVIVVARTIPISWYERWSLAYLLGAGALSGLWIVLSPFYHLIPAVWLLSILSALITFSMRSRLTALLGSAPRLHLSPLGAALAAVLVVEAIVLVFAAIHTPLGWDAVFNFEIKARIALENAPSGRYPIAYLSDPSRAWSHPQYPLMVPFAEFWIYSWLGRVDQSAIKILFPLFYLSLVGLLGGAVHRAANARVAMVVAIAIGVLPPLVTLPGAASGYADVPLAAAMTGAVGFGVLASRSSNPDAALTAAVLAAIGTWIKIEGLLLAGCLGILTVATLAWRYQQGERPAGALWRLTAPAWLPMLAAAPWLFIQTRHGIPSSDFVPLSLAAVASGLRRLPVVAELAGRELARPGHWAATWIAWLALIATMITSRRHGFAEWFLVGAVMLPLVMYVMVFTLSAWSDPAEHLRWALPRLIVPLVPAALLFIVLRLRADLRVQPG